MFIRDFSTVLGSGLVTRAATFATGVIIARVLGPEGKGIYALALLVPLLVSAFGGLGLSQSLIYHLRRKVLTLEQIVGTVFLADIAMGAALFGLMGIVAPSLTSNVLRGVPLPLIMLAALFIPIKMITRRSRETLRALDRMQAFSALSAATALPPLLAVLTILALGTVTVGRVVRLEVALSVVLLFITMWPVMRSLRGRPRPGFATLRKLLDFGLRSHIAYVLITVEKRFDLLILNAFLYPEYVGLYAVGVGVAQLVVTLTNAMGTVLFPRISGASTEEIRRFLPRIARLSVLAAVLCGLGLVAIGRPLIIFVYGAAFEASYAPMAILLPGIVMLCLSRVCEVYLTGQGRPGIVSAAAGVSLVVNLGANLLLIPSFGINGAAMASTLSYSLSTAMLMVLFLRSIDLRVRDIVVPRWADLTDLAARVRTMTERGSSPAAEWVTDDDEA